MLFDRQRETPFDLRFRLFGTPVRVHPFFWLVTLFLNFKLIRIGPEVLLLWVLCVFVSILLHEFGHVWMGHIFGTRGQIELQSMCGLAVGATHGGMTRWQRIAVYLAGPGIQFLFFGLIVAALAVFDRRPSEAVGVGNMFLAMARESGKINFFDSLLIRVNFLTMQPGWPQLAIMAVQFLIQINLWWAIINLLPVWPLDGGQVARELFVWRSPIYGVRNSLALSLVTALVVTINALSANMNGPRIPYLPAGQEYFILFFALFAVDSFLNLQMENARTRSGWRDPDDDDRLPWERDPDEWKRR